MEYSDIVYLWVQTENTLVTYDPGTNEVFISEFSSISRERVQKRFIPELFIRWLFNYRCIMCKRPATEINEIIPRSRSKDALKDYRNRVPLCTECHHDYHKDGVTEEKQKTMRMKRERFLIALGRRDYI